MNPLADIPLWIAIPVAFLVVAGSSLALIGTIGFVQLRTFYDRLHAPTLVTSWGAGAILLASMLLFSWMESRPVLHELLLGALILVVMPATYLLLARAVLHRDRASGSPYVLPAKPPQERQPD